MVMDTQRMAEIINYQHKQMFGVDHFHADERYDLGPAITETSLRWVFFNLIVIKTRNSFYPWTFTWTKNNKVWKVTLEPIIKKYTYKKNVTYHLDEEEMRLQLYNLINKKD